MDESKTLRFKKKKKKLKLNFHFFNSKKWYNLTHQYKNCPSNNLLFAPKIPYDQTDWRFHILKLQPQWRKLGLITLVSLSQQLNKKSLIITLIKISRLMITSKNAYTGLHNSELNRSTGKPDRTTPVLVFSDMFGMVSDNKYTVQD